MKTWNTHAWYITGILAALLIGSIAVQWDHVPDLPGIISFALGLSSLLLAIIAIIQTLTGSSDIASGLSAIRTAAIDVQSAAKQVSGVGGEVIVTSGKLVDALAVTERRLNTASVSQPLEAVAGRAQERTGPTTLDDGVPSTTPLGGYIALYACAWSFQTAKDFSMSDFNPVGEEGLAPYRDGFAAALLAFKIVEGSRIKDRIIVTKLSAQAQTIRDIITKSVKFPAAADDARFRSELARVDAYFAPDGSASAD